MVREAKELAKQRAELEAALAAERGGAQSHGYTPTPLTTPKPAKVSLTVQLLILNLEPFLSLVLTQGIAQFSPSPSSTGQ